MLMVSLYKVGKKDRMIGRLALRRSVGSQVRLFSQSRRALGVDIAAEEKCRELLDSLKPLEKLFDNHSTPSEEKLKTIAYLNTYSDKRHLSLWEQLVSFPKEHEDLYLENDADLYKLKASSGLIIDKIPYEDTATGEIKWKVVRDDDKREGWETIAHVLFVPAFVFLAAAIFFREDMDVTEWAKRELLYRIREQASTESNSEVLKAFDAAGGDPRNVEFDLAKFDKNDESVIERILSGEYDKLAKLQSKRQG